MKRLGKTNTQKEHPVPFSLFDPNPNRMSVFKRYDKRGEECRLLKGKTFQKIVLWWNQFPNHILSKIQNKILLESISSKNVKILTTLIQYFFICIQREGN